MATPGKYIDDQVVIADLSIKTGDNRAEVVDFAIRAATAYIEDQTQRRFDNVCETREFAVTSRDREVSLPIGLYRNIHWIETRTELPQVTIETNGNITYTVNGKSFTAVVNETAVRQQLSIDPNIAYDDLTYTQKQQIKNTTNTNRANAARDAEDTTWSRVYQFREWMPKPNTVETSALGLIGSGPRAGSVADTLYSAAQPVEDIIAVQGYRFPRERRDAYSTVRVNADWGYETIPYPIQEACKLMAIRYVTRFYTPLGGDVTTVSGNIVEMWGKDPDVQVLLRRYRRIVIL